MRIRVITSINSSTSSSSIAIISKDLFTVN